MLPPAVSTTTAQLAGGPRTSCSRCCRLSRRLRRRSDRFLRSRAALPSRWRTCRMRSSISRRSRRRSDSDCCSLRLRSASNSCSSRLWRSCARELHTPLWLVCVLCCTHTTAQPWHIVRTHPPSRTTREALVSPAIGQVARLLALYLPGTASPTCAICIPTSSRWCAAVHSRFRSTQQT